MEKEAIQKLLIKYNEGKCTEKEKAQLEDWYFKFNEHLPIVKSSKVKGIGKRIFRELPGNQHTFVKIGLALAAAAAFFGIVLTLTFKIWMPQPKLVKQDYAQNIRPGTNKAILTIGNGKKINLSQATQGQLGGINQQIFKTANGQIKYASIEDEASNAQSTIDNITTPKGGQWNIVLQDGTKVWLNSASSLTYPSSFKNSPERIVQLNGEAYFEVAKDKNHPFIVHTNHQQVTVLGTHFNINSYPDEPMEKTTLAEGSVKVSPVNGLAKTLKPGQQAILWNERLVISQADLDEALAWKKGYFVFKDESIQSIMRKLARWYNIDYQFDPDISDEGLNGIVSRNKNIDQVLTGLEAMKIFHFKVEGRRVKIMK